MPLYMCQDSYGYKFLRPIPKNFVPHFGKANFVKRLGRVRVDALRECAELTVWSNREIASAQAAQLKQVSLDSFLSQPSASRLKKISFTSDLAGQLSSLWLDSLNVDAKARQAGLEDEEFEYLDSNIKETLPAINRALANGQVGSFQNPIDQLLRMRGYELNATDGEWQSLTYAVIQHIQQGYEILSKRQEGKHLGPPDLSDLPPPLPAAWEVKQQEALPTIKRLEDVTPFYKEHLSTSDAKSQTTYLSIWKRFVEYTGNKPLALATSSDVFNFLKDRLHATEKPWSYGYTSGRAKRVLHEAFGLAKTLSLIAKNPVTEVDVLPKISAKEESRRKKPRFAYKAQHLNTLFQSEWYQPESSSWRGKMKEDLGARYWIPLLCMWHGLRVGEATQLQTHDVNLELSLVKVQVSEEDDRVGPSRSVKNSATVREVPIHPTLVELGFLDFVRSTLKNYDNGPLFPSALPEPGGSSPKWGRAYEQPFLRFMRDTLQLGSGYGNHSFRHALEDRIRAANAEQPWPEGLSRAYTGRATTRTQDKSITREEGSERLYGDGYEPSAILKYIEKITYPDVELPAPFVEWLGKREVVSKQLLAFTKRWKTTPQPAA